MSVRELSDAALAAEIAAATLALTPRHERPIPFCPHTPTPAQRLFLGLYVLSALYGGAAGGGKSDALLMAALMYVDVPGYAALILRRTYADLSLPGAIMDRARQWLTGSGATWNEKDKTWTFPSGATLTFGYCESDADVYRYAGAEFQFIAIDELTQWSEFACRYLMSRLRRLAGSIVPLRFRAATNPGGRGHKWVKEAFVEPPAGREPMGPFVPAKLEDNPHLDRAAYENSLALLDRETRDQLRHGRWVQDVEGRIYKRFDRAEHLVEDLPSGFVWHVIIAIDLGSSERKPTSAFVVLFWHEHSPVTYVGRSFAVADLTPSDFADIIGKMLETWPDARVVMDEGALGKGYANEMRRRYHLPVIPAQKRDKLGFRRLLNGSFERGEVLLVRGATDSLADELETLMWDDAGLDAAPGLADHETDALLYGVRESRAFAATEAPAKSPATGSPEWYQREAEEAERRDREAWRQAQETDLI